MVVAELAIHISRLRFLRLYLCGHVSGMVPGKMETRNVSFRVSILDPSVHEYVPDNRFELVRGTRSFVLHAVV